MFEFIVMCPIGSPDAAVPIAGSRAGALGVVNLELAVDLDAGLAQLRRLCALGHGRCGVLIDGQDMLEAVIDASLQGLDTILLANTPVEELGRLVKLAHGARLRTCVVATRLEEALAAQAAGADGVIAKGHEAGGWIGEEGSFVLSQRLLATLAIPVFIHGGIGLHTVAAAYVSGAAGAVLDAQLLLARESPLPEGLRRALSGIDGSETATLGTSLGAPFRAYSRPGLRSLELLRGVEQQLEPRAEARDAWRAEVKTHVAGSSADASVLPLGQDGAFAADLARRFGNVAGIIDGLRSAIADACETLQRANPLAEGAGVAQSHRTRYPLVQGPMTRVSDRAEFAAAVADGGALPFLALALMRGPDAEQLLARTADLLGDRSWGVGVLGFVPAELRAEQLEVVRRHRPPFALIAGGRPDQARELEADGIATYLHVPSPQLLKLYLKDGARRFVFEGRECGGHVGPRTSFVLWDSMLRVLLEELPQDVSDCHVLLAGGIHDAMSATMAAATAAAASKRGARIGALMGTAYLFTREATESGAITPLFQDAAVAALDTALLQSGPGHATRCLPSPFVEQFEAERRSLQAAGIDAEELRGRLEQLNIGRLRIAAKGVDRAADRDELTAIAASEQWEQGMYMIGQVTALRDGVTTVADLHDEVSHGSSRLLSELAAPAPAPEPPPPPPADVAIVGLGCILPGAPDVARLWTNILEKVDAITEVPAERWDWRQMYDPDRSTRDKVYSRWGGFIDPVPLDPMALGLPPKSLASIEPFQLLALLCAQSALKDAGYATRPFDRERTSVILGAGGGGADTSVGYTVRSALPSLLGDALPELQERLFERLPEWTEDSFAGLLMNVAAGRIANRLDFGGTNYTVDAACASSLGAIGLAARELQVGTSDMVLAGGVDAIQNPFAYLCFSKTQALSPTGRCRPFDANADGIAISEGFATVVLKRLADAERDGDRIYAVIRGVGAASDGRDRSLTAPRPEGQMRALRRAYAQAGFSPATVGLVEAHGTGTVAGDGAEVKALTTVFAEHSEQRQWCAIGSIKSMIGHTKATAGVAGIVKAALALHHRVLPPTIGVSEPNPKAGFAESPFYVNSEARPWLTGAAEHPRRAGVSAFGFGGTDFHIVLEEYQGAYLTEPDAAVSSWPGELLLWRGSSSEVMAALDRLDARLATGEELHLKDIAHESALAIREQQHGEPTLALVVESLEDLGAKLARAREILGAGEVPRHQQDGIYWSAQPLSTGGKVAFLFPGQGSQVVDMGRELAMAFPEALEQFELADRVLAGFYERPLSSYLFPPPSFTPEERSRRQAELTDTHVAQAAIGATELAYLRVLQALGVEPDQTAGHSYGEFAALAAAGGIDAEQMLRISEARGRFMKEASAAEAGAMVAVQAPPDALTQLLEDGVVVAANLNSPRQTVLSGPREHVEAAVEWCRERDIGARMLPVACAFHSPHVAGAQQKLAQLLHDATLAVPRIPVYSNTTGDVHAPQPDAIAALLSEHLIRPVDFVHEIEAMHRDGARVFVEVGPRSALTGLVPQILGDREHIAVSTDRSGRSGLLSLLHCLAALAAEGVPIDLIRLHRGRHAGSLDAQGEGREEEGPRAPWLVDGGGAWPVGAQRGPAVPIPGIDQKESVVTSTSTNGDRPLPPTAIQQRLGLADLHPGQSPPNAVEAGAPQSGPGEISGPPLAGDRVADVVLRHQQVMQQFLETQRTVMLNYLGAAQGAPPIRPVVATPRRPAPALPAQPAQAPRAPATPESAFTAPAQIAPAPEQPVPTATVPAAAEHATAAAEHANGSTSLSAAEIEARILALVSDRTGYPADMLGLDADLEGDLGIDSIKRVEIAGTFRQSLPEADRERIDIEQLTESRTLRAVIDTLAATLGTPTAGAGGAPPGEQAVVEEQQRPFEQGPAEQERIGRFVVHAASAPAITATAGLAATGAVVIVDDGCGVGAELAGALADQGHHVVRLSGDAQPQNAQQAAQVAADLREHGGAKALLHLAALSDPAPEYGALRTLLALVQALREDLEAAAGAGGAVVLGATRMGGTFGLAGSSRPGRASHGALHGFLKTLAQESPTVRVKSVDLADCPAERTVELLRAELSAADGLVEVGYSEGERKQLALAPTSLAERPAGEMLDGDCVLLVTGGARGITARTALMLAERHRPTLVLVGRTAIEEESPVTSALRDPAELRQALIEQRRQEQVALTPALVERDCQRILRAREARENLERLRATGARIHYHVCDVSDQAAFTDLIDSVYERHGRIDGVVHGAGVIEDKLIRDKQSDSLERVMSTKAGAALTLAERLRPDGLRFLVLFSSVSGRFGNRGQADYAAASEVLGKLAHELDSQWPARVVSIDWGPWAAGMVSPLLEQEFARRGVALIGLEEGCRLLEQEMAGGRKGETEVVIGAASGLAGVNGASPLQADAGESATMPLIAGLSEIVRAPDGGTMRALYTLDLQRDRYLDDHRIDGRAVLPFAAAMELMAEVAVAAVPGREIAGLRDIRLLDGVALEDDRPVSVRIDAEPQADAAEVELTINPVNRGRAHYRARAQLRDPAEPVDPASGYVPRFARGQADAAAPSPPAPLADLAPFPIGVEDAYRDLLFHGPLFQGIVAIDGMDERGASALLRPSQPGRCVAGADGGRWLLDPVLLDSALQIQVVWARMQWDVTLLPAEIGCYEQAAAAGEGELVRHELRIRPASTPPLCHADHWFFGADGRLLAVLQDVVGVGTQTLNRLAGARP